MDSSDEVDKIKKELEIIKDVHEKVCEITSGTRRSPLQNQFFLDLFFAGDT